MSIKSVIEILNKEFKTNISSEYYTQIDEWRQWWRGNVQSFHTFRELQERGTYKTRELYSMRMAKKICEDWASILLNEKTEIIINDVVTSEYLQGETGYGGVFGNIDFWEEANALVEKSFYSGTGAFVMKIDNLEVSKNGAIKKSPRAQIRMEYLPAFCIIPITRRYGRITEAAFVSETTVRGKKYVYLEIHTLENDVYVIENRYYSQETGKLKSEELPDGIASKFNTGSPLPFFSIISPNVVNTFDNNLGLGCSIYAHAIDNLKGVDLAFNNFCRDFKLGGKKVFYNRELTKAAGTDSDGKPIYITPDDMMQQLFVSIGDEYVDDQKLVHEFNPDLRVKDNQDGVQAQLDYLSFKCGLGTRYYVFSENRRSAQITATQYIGEKQELKQNAAKHGIIVERAIRDIVKAILWTGKNILGQEINPEADITVEFADGYIVSEEEKRNQDIQDVRDRVMAVWEYRMKWYGEDEATAKSKIVSIQQAFGSFNFPPGEDGI
ncbi:MAG: phage portal protein [Ruminococcaceae bacterium]|nr:phage portal protein [Oscillospiraceae bacterium]